MSTDYNGLLNFGGWFKGARNIIAICFFKKWLISSAPLKSIRKRHHGMSRRYLSAGNSTYLPPHPHEINNIDLWPDTRLDDLASQCLFLYLLV